jgi:hypothetical protein
LAVLFVLGSIVALGCSGSPPDDDDDDDDQSGGSSGTGGLGGFAGASGTSGTSGTSGDIQSCYNVCENYLDCPVSTPINCVESCRQGAMGPCALEHQRVFDCLDMFNVCTDPATACSAVAEAYLACSDPSFCMENPSSTYCL